MTSADLTDTVLGMKEVQELTGLCEFKKNLIMNLREGKVSIDKIGKDAFNIVVENTIHALKQLKECEDRDVLPSSHHISILHLEAD